MQRMALLTIWFKPPYGASMCSGGTYNASLWDANVAADEDDNDDGQLDSTYGTSRRSVVAELKDEAFKLGYTHVRIEDDSDIATTTRLIASKKRLAIRAEFIAKCEATAVKLRLYRSIAEAMKSPNAEAIADFYREWRLVTGYGQAPDTEALSILSAGKRSLIECLLSRARQESWSYGVLKDDKAHNDFNDVFYVDAPQGQVSFHIKPGELGDIPAYSGKWSEMHNSDIILAMVFTKPASTLSE